MKFAITNTVLLAALIAAWVAGYLDPVIREDTTYLCFAIFGVFLLLMTIVGKWYYEEIPPDSNGVKLLGFRGDTISYFSRWLITLGLIGTIIGFSMTFLWSNIDYATLKDPNQIPEVISYMLRGMGTALLTTLVGLVLSLVVEVNERLYIHKNL